MFNYFKKWLSIFLALILFFISSILELTSGQNRVIVIVIDGARYTETFGGGATYIPHLYNEMLPNGTLYANFRIDFEAGANTITNPGHATIETGTWQIIANDGSERPTLPTIFEYMRKEDGNPQSDCYVVTGKSKLNILTYSTFPEYGSDYGATWLGDDNRNDSQTYDKVIATMSTVQPKLLVVNFAQVDNMGHNGNWENYTAAITNADNYIYQIWQHIQNSDYGYNINNTTLFITNDHGRHSSDFTNHGDGCDGCTHIMLLALGRNIISQIINDAAYQRDIAPTIGDLLGFTTSYSTGTSLFNYTQPLPVELFSFSSVINGSTVNLIWETKTEVNNYGFEIERRTNDEAWLKVGFANGNGNSNSPKSYTYTDKNPIGGSKFQYRLKQIDNDGQFEYSDIIETILLPNEYDLYQNYPNPFNPSTKIKYQVPLESEVQIKLYDILGNEVKTLVSSQHQPGIYELSFEASNLSSGVYFYKMQSNNYSKIYKMMILK